MKLKELDMVINKYEYTLIAWDEENSLHQYDIDWHSKKAMRIMNQYGNAKVNYITTRDNKLEVSVTVA